MQEIALLLSSIAGACTAAAFKKIPKNKNNVISLSANIHIKNQINSLRLEKEILNKTISRLYQYDMEMPKIQRDKLLLRYQHQLGIVLARIEKLEAANKHPDLGALGDGLITLMDQKLSNLDKRLYEISAKINLVNTQAPEKKSINVKPTIETKHTQKEKQSESAEQTSTQQKAEASQLKEAIQTKLISPTQYKKIELTTLTELPNKIPEFFKNEVVHNIQQVKPQEQKQIEDAQSSSDALLEKQKEPQIQIPSPDTKQTEQPIKKPEPKTNLPVEENDDEEDDLDKIKGEIMKTLSKLEQAEVE